MTTPFQGCLARLAGRLPFGPGAVYLTGGALRDLLLDRSPRDLDLLVEGDAGAKRFTLQGLERLAGMTPVVFHRRPPATYRVVLDGVIVDALFCPPDEVAIHLRRRDFTINAMAAPLAQVHAITESSAPGRAGSLKGILVDPLEGLKDLQQGLLRAATRSSLSEDPLRLLRAVRLEITLDGFNIHPDLREEIRALAPRITRAAAERIGSEMILIMESRRAGAAVRELDSLGLLDRVLPELDPLRGVEQPALYHDHDVREHTLRAVEEAEALAAGADSLEIDPPAAPDAAILKWSALLHDIGKAACATRDADGVPHFYGHEQISADLAGEALRRLRIPNHTLGPVVSLIRWHVRLGALATVRSGDRPIRRLVRLAGGLLPLLVLLSLADRRAAGGENAAGREASLMTILRRALELSAEISRIAHSPPLLDGREVMDLLGLAPGPRVGSILRWLDRLRTERRIQTREEAISLLRTLPPPRITD
jgi:poly(A) polymerase